MFPIQKNGQKVSFILRFLLGHEQAPADDGLLEFGGAAREGKVKPAVPDLPYPAALHLAGAAVHIIERLALLQPEFLTVVIFVRHENLDRVLRVIISIDPGHIQSLHPCIVISISFLLITSIL